MTSLFKKLNFKDQKEICIINHPSEFDPEFTSIKKFTNIITKIEDCKKIKFILIFVMSKTEIETYFKNISKELKDDCVLWFAYPKGTSKKYKVEISRDKGWEILRENGFETVRAVAIDNDWSALRFRDIAYIKILLRNKNSFLKLK
jgi:hypothetical protein